eukprot:24349-Hanusia_phi.AAC.2
MLRYGRCYSVASANCLTAAHNPMAKVTGGLLSRQGHQQGPAQRASRWSDGRGAEAGDEGGRLLRSSHGGRVPGAQGLSSPSQAPEAGRYDPIPDVSRTGAKLKRSTHLSEPSSKEEEEEEEEEEEGVEE